MADDTRQKTLSRMKLYIAQRIWEASPEELTDIEAFIDAMIKGDRVTVDRMMREAQAGALAFPRKLH